MGTNDIQDLVYQLELAKEAYHNSSHSLMSDGEFDLLEDKLKKIAPTHPYFQQIGSPSVETNNKIRHPQAMRSLNKVKTISELEKWIKRIGIYDAEWLLEPKIDGISATCYYEQGKLKYVATRGDGVEGQNITHIAQYCLDIPVSFTFPESFNDLSSSSFEVRGELYLPKNTDFNTNGKPLRNNCSGLINRKEMRDAVAYVRFAAYQIRAYSKSMEDRLSKESLKILFLKKAGFHVPQVSIVSNLDEINEKYNLYLKELREKWLYETDGMVLSFNDNRLFAEIDSRWVVDHHHHYAIAIKPPALGGLVTLKEIEWNESRHGSLIPTAIFTPLVIHGATIERATLNNYQNVVKLQLQIHDQLYVERANDVIPYISYNASQLEGRELENNFIPSSCPSCGNELDEKGVHLVCPNFMCPELIVQQILFWITQAKMKNIAEKTIRLLISEGRIKSIADLYRLTAKDFENLRGFQSKKIENFITEQQKSLSITTTQFISRLGIPLVQEKSLQKLDIFRLEDFLNFDDNTYVIGQNIKEWLTEEHNQYMLKELLSVLVITDDLPKSTEIELKSVVCTGKAHISRSQLKNELQNIGYELSNDLNKNTTLLLCDSLEGNSSKIQKAKKLNILMVTYEDFFRENTKDE